MSFDVAFRGLGQKAQLWWDLPAADCFLLMREMYRLPPDRYNKDLAYLAEALEVGALLTTQIRRLSLGERARTGFLAHDPVYRATRPYLHGRRSRSVDNNHAFRAHGFLSGARVPRGVPVANHTAPWGRDRGVSFIVVVLWKTGLRAYSSASS